MIDWQPIKTAPKDGRDLLLWCVVSDRGRARMGSWRKDEGFSGNKRKLWLADDHNDFSVGYASTPLHPTHWSEVNPPKAEAKQRIQKAGADQ